MPYSPQDLHKKILGKKGEKAVLHYVKKQRMKVLKRNYTTPFGEADLVAQDRDEIVFIEVKTRTNEKYGTPREAVGPEKQRRYRQIATFYGKEIGEEPNARFDVAEVDENCQINYIKYAF